MEPCFCGADARATCQGECGRRVCERHAVHENNLQGYIKPDEALVHSLRSVEQIARFGYGARRGVRCPDCRNRDAVEALVAAPGTPPDDPIERRAYEYLHFGSFEPFPAGQWGPSYARAAEQRGLRKGTFSLSSRKWTSKHPVHAGVAVWSFTMRMPGQATMNATDQSWIRTVFELDERGCSPKVHSREIKRFLRSSHWDTTVSWVRGPVAERRDLEDLFIQTGVIESLVGEPERILAPRHDDVSWIGLEPAEMYDWMTRRRD
jgi:hypothetical protein